MKAVVVSLWDDDGEDDDDEDEAEGTGEQESKGRKEGEDGGTRGGKVQKLLSSFQGLDPHLADYLLRQCGGDVAETSRYILQVRYTLQVRYILHV